MSQFFFFVSLTNPKIPKPSVFTVPNVHARPRKIVYYSVCPANGQALRSDSTSQQAVDANRYMMIMFAVLP